MILNVNNLKMACGVTIKSKKNVHMHSNNHLVPKTFLNMLKCLSDVLNVMTY